MPSLPGKVRGRFDALVSAAAQPVPCLAPPLARRHLRAFAALVVGAIGLAYLLTVNGYWHLTADSGIYLTLAQNLRAGNGYLFNGVPHTKYPGGLPYMLAAAMTVSRSFLWLNLVQCAVMLLSLAVLYAALRQMAGRATALLALLLTAMLFWTHEYSTALMSEAPFFLCSNLSVLLLLLLVRAGPGRGRALLLAGVCAGWGLAFWCRVAASFWIGPFAVALLLSGRDRHRLHNRLANAALVSGVILLGLLLYFRWVEAPRPDVPQGAAISYGVELNPAKTARAALRLPRWPMLVLCPPYNVVARRALPPRVADAANWLLAAVLLAGVWQALRRGQVLLGASLLFLGPLAVWGVGSKATTGRYGLAVAPFLVLLLLMGLEAAGRLVRGRLGGRLRAGWLVNAGIAFVLLPNLLLLAGEVVVQRRADFYGVYRGGAYMHLMGIVRWMAERDLRETVALQDSCAWGAVGCLTQCRYVRLPKGIRMSAPDGPARLAEFARAEGIRYVVTRSFDQPWPTWHLSPRHLGKQEPRPPYFRLWEYDASSDSLREIQVPPAVAWPTRVPGKPPKR